MSKLKTKEKREIKEKNNNWKKKTNNNHIHKLIIIPTNYLNKAKNLKEFEYYILYFNSIY
jgi:hypothetical protein